MSTATTRLVLIEPRGDRIGGHYQRTLHALADACPEAVVITPAGISGVSARLLSAVAAVVAAAAWLSSKTLSAPSRPQRCRRIRHQLTLLRECLIEAACLRTVARRATGEPVAVVILTAREGLHALAAALGGRSHLRFVHEIDTTEDPALRLLGRLAARAEHRVGLLCPTAAVHRQVSAAFPRLHAVVRAYAVDDGNRLTDTEIHGARAIFGITDPAPVVCLVGGWWAHKDITVIDAALSRICRPLNLLVTGDPLDTALLARWRGLPMVRLHVEPGPLPQPVLRLVYAAADASLVARHAGVGMESGLVADTARLGVPLLVSDHDQDLTAALTGQDWVRMFPTGDPAALAVILDRLAEDPLPRPPEPAPKALGMPTAAGQATFLTETAIALFGDGR